MLMLDMRGGYAVFGNTQFLPRYCVILPKKVAHCLNDLTLEERRDFLVDMSIVGDAIIHVCNPLRINYDILGNTDQFLHGHIFPRYNLEKKRE